MRWGHQHIRSTCFKPCDERLRLRKKKTSSLRPEGSGATFLVVDTGVGFRMLSSQNAKTPSTCKGMYKYIVFCAVCACAVVPLNRPFYPTTPSAPKEAAVSDIRTACQNIGVRYPATEIDISYRMHFAVDPLASPMGRDGNFQRWMIFPAGRNWAGPRDTF